MPRQSFDTIIVVSNGAKRFSTSVKWKKSQNNMERRPQLPDKKQIKRWW